ncbi:MAG: hypothetical protein ABFD81_19090 [Syntrophaceae bacterium]
MMIVSRETIYAALFTLASGAANFVTTDRRLHHLTEVPYEQCPALFQLQDKEVIERRRGVPPRYMLYPELWVYVHTGNAENAIKPSQLLNPLIDAIETALEPVKGKNHIQDLGLPSAVSDCRIEGTIQIFEGIMGTTAVAIIPIVVVTT